MLGNLVILVMALMDLGKSYGWAQEQLSLPIDVHRNIPHGWRDGTGLSEGPGRREQLDTQGRLSMIKRITKLNLSFTRFDVKVHSI
jgi:hypothetical protein